jgi:hypothetical protein
MPTREEAKAYSRGYAAGQRRAWPAYHPPSPPDAMSAEIVKSAQALASKVADWCGAFGDDDEFSREMAPLLQAVDDANEKLTKWLRSAANR